MNVEPQELRARIGTEIMVASKILKDGELHSAILHGVEHGGIWIETSGINESFLEKIQEKMYDYTPLIFLPYSSIDAILSGVQRPIISDKIAE